MSVTPKMKIIADNLIASISIDPKLSEAFANIKKENEAAEAMKKAQIPTYAQMHREFTI